jgi:MbtH protein
MNQHDSDRFGTERWSARGRVFMDRQVRGGNRSTQFDTELLTTIGKGETMNTDEKEDNTIYKVVLNHEEQYSIWPADRENALGWNDAGKTGSKEECLAYIKEVWTDMRPLSLRKKMAETEASRAVN